MRIHWMLPGFVAIVLASCAPIGEHASSVPPPPQALATGIPALLAETRVPSVSVARLERGRIAWAGAWGLQGPGVAATPDTLYNIASLTKPISAETVLRAASAGRLTLDEPMSPYWVDPDIVGDPRHSRLTPRLALTHRTGFPNWRYETGNRLVFRNDPGTIVGYSGEGFEYLARFAERRTGTPFERLAEELVLQPAGMASTAFTRRDWFAGRVATPHDGEGRPLEPSIADTYFASDEVHTTASDYARFLAGVAAHQGLSEAVARDRERVQVSTREQLCAGARAATCPDEAGWGLGWDLAVFGEERVLWHTGGDRGEFTFAYVIPATGEGAVILTNSAVGYKVVLPFLERMRASPRFLGFLRAQAG